MTSLEKLNEGDGREKPEESREEVQLTPEEETQAIEILRNSPSKFCKLVLGLEPFPYQQTFLDDQSKRILVCAGRQVGKSLITAVKALWFALSHPSTKTLIVSATQRQSMLTFRKIIDYVESSKYVHPSIVRKTQTMIVFRNRSEIHALPCGPSGKSLRGSTAHLIIIDEAAYVPENVITEVAMPMLSTTGGTMIMISTPARRDHFFFRAFTSPSWTKYQFKSSDNPLISADFLKAQREQIGEAQFRQEFLAEFVDEETTYFPMSLLRSCVHQCADKAACEYCAIVSGTVPPSGDLYAGYDPGGMSDPAALVVIQRFQDQEKKSITYRVVLTKSFLRAPGEQEGNIYTMFTVKVAELHRNLHLRRIMVDSTGLGRPILEHCKELKLPVTGVTLSPNTKEEILTNLHILLEKKRLILPDSLDLLSNISCVTEEKTRTGGRIFSKNKGSHDDLCYALALALWGSRTAPTVILTTS